MLLKVAFFLDNLYFFGYLGFRFQTGNELHNATINYNLEKNNMWNVT